VKWLKEGARHAFYLTNEKQGGRAIKYRPCGRDEVGAGAEPGRGWQGPRPLQEIFFSAPPLMIFIILV